MKKVNKFYKIIIDSNILISFLIGKKLIGLQNYIDSQDIKIITGDKDLLILNKINETIILSYNDFDRIILTSKL
jgi:predicted nucleic acid-binding protein